MSTQLYFVYFLDVCAMTEKPCMYGGMCEKLVGGYKCNCEDGYGGRNCENTKNYCAPSPCGTGSSCYNEYLVNTTTTAICSCHKGYELKKGQN